MPLNADVLAVKPTYDAVVVRSGFGGGIAACRLAEAGMWRALRLAARWAPSRLRTQFGRTLRRMEDPNYTQVSYRVFNIGASNKLPAESKAP